MKIKYTLPLLAVGILCMTATGCSEKKDDFDAVGYAQALLDAHIKGDTGEYAKLSGDSGEDMKTLFDENLQTLVTLSVGENTNAPGSEVISPQLYQDYTDMWKKVLESTKYKTVESEKKGDSYSITVETQMMDLNTPVNDLLTDKLTEYYADAQNNQEEGNTTETYLTLMLESYQEVLKNLTYADPEQTTITLSPDKEKKWTISEDDIQTIKDNVFTSEIYPTTEVSGEDSSATPESPQSEGAPDQSYPEDLAQTPSHQAGEKFILQQDGQDAVEFSIDKVEVTEERSEFDPSNPEKVVVITYTYKNLLMEDPVLYDQMSFKVLEGDSTCPPYYLQNLQAADIAPKDGAAVTASLAYGVSASCNEITIYVNNSQVQSPFQVTVSLS